MKFSQFRKLHGNPRNCAKFKVNKVPVSVGLRQTHDDIGDLGDEGGVDPRRRQSEKAIEEGGEQRLEVVQK